MTTTTSIYDYDYDPFESDQAKASRVQRGIEAKQAAAEAEVQAEADRHESERQAVIEAEQQAEQDYQARRDQASADAVRSAVISASITAGSVVRDVQSAFDTAAADPDVGLPDLFTKWTALRTATEVAAVTAEYGHHKRAAQRRTYPPTGVAAMTFASAVEQAIAQRVASVACAEQSSLATTASREAERAAAKVKQ